MTGNQASSDFELALNLIGEVIALYSRWISNESNGKNPDQQKIADLSHKQAALYKEKYSLNITEPEKITSAIERCSSILKLEYSKKT